MSKIQKGTEEFQMFQDFWQLYNDFHDVELGEDFLEKAKIAIDDFLKKYKQFYIGEKLWGVLFEYINHELIELEGKNDAQTQA